ncbi:hypothetical protein OUZ56_029405 [Daphnia magna]|uniref:Uncharacterized protein n=1 Tax=Daphnia magna TaxID=35525 RepID=A0ABR0B6Q7_9CRUS|nr:hypothetical protein OUZ56_029405 [Daphnia magna]
MSSTHQFSHQGVSFLRQIIPGITGDVYYRCATCVATSRFHRLCRGVSPRLGGLLLLYYSISPQLNKDIVLRSRIRLFSGAHLSCPSSDGASLLSSFLTRYLSPSTASVGSATLLAEVTRQDGELLFRVLVSFHRKSPTYRLVCQLRSELLGSTVDIPA